MHFDHYTDQPVALAVALVNTFGWVSGIEYVQTPGDLTGLLEAGGDGWPDSLPNPQPADLDGVRQLRDQLRQVFVADDEEAATTAINLILAEHGATPRLSVHDGKPHVHFEPVDGSIVGWLAVVTAMGLANVLAEHGQDRLGTCQADACDDVYVDTSRNRSRRHCSTTCGTREHVAAHRQRRREAT